MNYIYCYTNKLMDINMLGRQMMSKEEEENIVAVLIMKKVNNTQTYFILNYENTVKKILILKFQNRFQKEKKPLIWQKLNGLKN